MVIDFKVWTSANKKKVPIVQMDTTHIENTIRLLSRRLVKYRKDLDIETEEEEISIIREKYNITVNYKLVMYDELERRAMYDE